MAIRSRFAATTIAPRCTRDARSSSDLPEAHRLAGRDVRPHPPGMFVVSEAEAAAIRAVFDQRGELSAAIELRRLFPGITDTAQARECARTIAGWKPLPAKLHLVRRSRRRAD
jgi:hypothetical protein